MKLFVTNFGFFSLRIFEPEAIYIDFSCIFNIIYSDNSRHEINFVPGVDFVSSEKIHPIRSSFQSSHINCKYYTQLKEYVR